MKLALMITGVIIIVIGIVDLMDSGMGFDIWAIIGFEASGLGAAINCFELEGKAAKYSSYIVLMIGGLMFKVGNALGNNVEANKGGAY